MTHPNDNNPNNLPPESDSPAADASGTPHSAAPHVSPAQPFRLPRLSGAGFKIALVLILALTFLLPLSLVSELTSERRERRNEATEAVADSWAGEAVVAAPYLVVPCDYRYRDSQDRWAVATEPVLIHPESLRATIKIRTQIRQRGIFPVPVFSATVRLEGAFIPPADRQLRAELVRARWDEAWLLLPLTSTRGIAALPSGTWGDTALAFDAPRPGQNASGPALAAAIPADSSHGGSFAIDLELKGTSRLSVVSAARSTACTLEADWSSPAFEGSSLPETRDIGPAGTAATWNIVAIGETAFSPPFTAAGLIDTRELIGSERGSYGFGLSYFGGPGAYQLTDRALKYGFLFIAVPFAALFLCETLRRVRIHPVQYLLVGAADSLFFLVLLALSEHILFGAAYLAAAALTTVLAAWYATSFLPRRRDALVLGATLAALYGYLYGALQSEDYALLIGSLGLVVILAAVMALTRRLDWYRFGR